MKYKFYLAIRFLKYNKIKTSITLLILIMSICLLSSLLLLKTSSDNFSKREETFFNGDYQLAIDINNKNDVLISNSFIEEKSIIYEYAVSKNADSSYTKILSVNENSCIQIFKIWEGYFPKSTNEALISRAYAQKNQLQIGDNFSLQTGTRLLNGENINTDINYSESEVYVEDETLTKLKVAGIYNPNVVENSVALSDEMVLFNNYKGSTGIEYIKLNPSAAVHWMEIKDNYSTYINPHGENLLLKKNTTNPIGTVLLFVCLITIILLMLLISNILSISIKERSRQYGILKSIGAFKGQIITLSMIEIYLYSIFALPIGVGLSLFISSFMLGRMSELSNMINLLPFTFTLSIDYKIMLFISCIILFIITISCFITIYPILKKTPIALIRNSPKTKKNKTIKFYFTEHLFGIECALGKCYSKQNKNGKSALLLSLSLSFILLFTGIFALDMINENYNTKSEHIVVSFKNTNTSKQYNQILNTLNSCVNNLNKTEYIFKSSLILDNILIENDLINKETFEQTDSLTKTLNIIGVRTKKTLFKDSQESFLHNEITVLNKEGNMIKLPYFDLKNEHLKVSYPTKKVDSYLQLQFKLAPVFEASSIDIETTSIPTLFITTSKMKQIIAELNKNNLNEFSILSTLEINEKHSDKLIKSLKSKQNDSNGLITNIKKINNQTISMLMESYIFILIGITTMIIMISVINLLCIAINGILSKQKDYAILLSFGIERIQLLKLLFFENTLTICKAYLLSIPFYITIYCMIFYLMFKNTMSFYIPWKILLYSFLFVIIIIFTIIISSYYVLKKICIIPVIYDSE